jgi:hypothetical protein
VLNCVLENLVTRDLKSGTSHNPVTVGNTKLNQVKQVFVHQDLSKLSRNHFPFGFHPCPMGEKQTTSMNGTQAAEGLPVGFAKSTTL